MSYKVVLIGRPNVGKSTIFNLLIKQHISIVLKRPGVTRDRKTAEIRKNGLSIEITDTGGFIVSEDTDKLTGLIREQIDKALADADLILFVTDVKVGCTAYDMEIANLIRERRDDILIVVNKCDDNYERDLGSQEFYRLGLGEPFVVSATTGFGIDDLRDEISKRASLHKEGEIQEESENNKGIRVAVLGTPNVGKSSFLNSLLNDNRLIVSELPGTTIDTVDVKFTYGGHEFIFIDTAGIRRRKRIRDELEEISVKKSIATIDRASVVIVMLDANEEISLQTKRIVSLVEDRGRGIIFFANKWDLVLKNKRYRNEKAFMKEFYYIFKASTYAPLIIDSAIRLRRKRDILNLIIQVDQNFKKRIKTSELNNLIERVQIEHPPYGIKGRMIKFFYAAQTGESPPNITIFTNYPDEIHFAYQRYLINRIRENFGFEGVPIRIDYRSRDRNR